MKSWVKIALSGVLALVVLGSVAYFFLRELGGAERRAAMDALRARVLRPVEADRPPETVPGAPLDNSLPTAADPALELRQLRYDTMDLATKVTPRSPVWADPDSLWSRAHRILDGLRAHPETVLHLSASEVDTLREFLAQNDALWSTLDLPRWRRIQETLLLPDLTAREANSVRFVRIKAQDRHLMKAVLYAHDGDNRAALIELTAHLRAGGELGDTPSLPIEIIRLALQVGALPQDAETELLSELARKEQPEAVRLGRKADLALAVRMVDAYPVPYIAAGPAPPLVAFTRRAGGQILLDYNLRYFAENVQRVVDAEDLPYPESQAAMSALFDEFNNRFLGSLCGNGTFLLLAERYSPTHNARRKAWSDLTRLAILLERYRADRGAYPQTLDALGDRFAHGLPEDPFSGKPYLYTVEGNGFALKSQYVPEPEKHYVPQEPIIWRHGP